MIAKLTAPYPAPRAGRASLTGSVFLGLFVAVFLYYFRPFGLRQDPYGSRPVLLAVFGLITFFASLILETLVPLAFPGLFRDNNWRVGHQIAFYLLLLLVIATLNGLYVNYVQQLDFSWRNFAIILGQTVALGILPVTIVVLYRYNAKLAYYLERAVEMDARSGDRVAEEAGELPFEPALLAAEAYGNYVKLYFASPEGWRQEIERTTLRRVVEERSAQGLLRCHRSYAVVAARVRRVSGNAQGLKLLVGRGALEIPVSRSYLAAVRQALES